MMIIKNFFFVIIVISTLGLIFLTGQSERKGDPKFGKIIFEKNCASCHGKRGEGLGPVTRMPNFSEKQYQETRTNQQLYEKITNGGQGTGMPAWNKTLTEEDRWNAIAYIRTLGTH